MAEVLENAYAVVIGVDENQIMRLALPTVAKDVQAVYDVLVHPERCAYSPEHVKLLRGAASTGQNIIAALDWLRDKVNADPDATAVIYYSGHGMVDTATNQYYLIPYDIPDLPRLRANALKAEALTATIAEIQAQRMLIVLDCCHAAGMDVKAVDVELGEKVAARPFPLDLPAAQEIPPYTGGPGSKEISDLMEGEGRAILNSSTGTQSSYVRRDGRMSLFTYHLIEALTGHAPHPDDATVVYVTDVMSWVTHQVKKSAAREGVAQTPVMRTSGVFPVAQLLGGKGVALSKGDVPPNPLAPLPAAAFDQRGQSVAGTQVNVTGDADIDQLGDKTIHGDEVHGDKVAGDQISVGNISGATGIAIGRGASASVTQQAAGAANLGALFAPLQTLVAQAAPQLSGKVNALRAQVERGAAADDTQVANLVQDIVDGVPAAGTAVVTLFNHPHATAAAGPTTQFVLSRLR